MMERFVQPSPREKTRLFVGSPLTSGSLLGVFAHDNRRNNRAVTHADGVSRPIMIKKNNEREREREIKKDRGDDKVNVTSRQLCVMSTSEFYSERDSINFVQAKELLI